MNDQLSPSIGQRVVSGDYEYKVLKDGTASITKYTGTITHDLVIPEQLDGLLVTELSGYTFASKGLTGHLTIPENINRIDGSNVFSNNNLTSVEIKSKQLTTTSNAFRANNIKEIIFPEGYDYTIPFNNLFSSQKTDIFMYLPELGDRVNIRDFIIIDTDEPIKWSCRHTSVSIDDQYIVFDNMFKSTNIELEATIKGGKLGAFTLEVFKEKSFVEVFDSIVPLNTSWKADNNFAYSIDELGFKSTRLAFSGVKVTGEVDTTTEGVYPITYTKDKFSRTINVTVKDTKMKLEAHDSELLIGETWDPTDNLDKAIGEFGEEIPFSEIEYEGTVDIEQIGEYPIIYNYQGIKKGIVVSVIEPIIVKASYVDLNGKELEQTEERLGKTGDPYSFEPKKIEGYVLASINGEVAGNISEETEDIVFKYIKAEQVLNLNQEVYNEDGNSLDKESVNKEDSLNYKLTVSLNKDIELSYYSLDNISLTEVIDASLENVRNIKLVNSKGEELPFQLETETNTIIFSGKTELSSEWILTYDAEIPRTAETATEIKEKANVTLTLKSDLLEIEPLIAESNEVVTIIAPSPLTLIKAPKSISFGRSNIIPSSTQSYEYEEVDMDDKNIVINDGRGTTGGWSLFGKMEKELTNGNYVLSSALSYKEQVMDSINGALIHNQEKTENSKDLTIEINKEDLLLTILPGQARQGEFEGVILWSLRDVPSNTVN
ncbi:hypothetical protein E4Z98_06315 [Vagococcus xieshaowenii]|uniref:Uncharacterized protein n=2 Tax=Vagococcus xieshaowenii TaxID=2562451 RepID=A0AAJ5JKU3_9ENTE|nr:hypothetical protein E4Z98_06315 [Vagococcus xieshaowenii]TFZ39241.1 hypothetical protein E4031_09550 [Vagococcus xieshaowenii]